jgi:H+/Cl- antiporter ClcA
MAGVAAGFGSVFGTPIAATVFALEVIAIGRVKYDALLPCFLAAVMANFVCTMCGIEHTQYHINFHQQASNTFFNFKFDYHIILWVIISALIFGIVSNLFTATSNSVKRLSNKYIKWKYVTPLIGGLLIIMLTYISGTTDYLGLGVKTQNGDGNSILNAFKIGELNPLAWLWKSAFTVITLGTGFKGGEVTPLFFIGASLGNSIATIGGMPVDLFAALGFIAVFAGATNTPLACTIMGAELFGTEHTIYFAIACFIAYYFSGRSSIYNSHITSNLRGNETNNSDMNK